MAPDPVHAEETAEERSALDAAAAGQRAALGDVLAGYRPRLGRTLGVRMHPGLARRVDVSDVLQEAYVEVTERLDEYLVQRESTERGAMPLFLWVRFIALQKLAQLYRFHIGAAGRDLRREQVEVADPDLSAIHLVEALVASGVTPSGAFAAEEQRARLLGAIEALDPVDREILLLRHFEELSNNEAATLLGISPSAASRRRMRALGELQRVLASLDVSLPGGAPRRGAPGAGDGAPDAGSNGPEVGG